MNTKSKIEKAIGRKGDIYKGWHVARQKEGWIFRPFGQNEVFLGSNEKEAVEVARQMKKGA